MSLVDKHLRKHGGAAEQSLGLGESQGDDKG
jgi:hypothetical protein